MKKLPVALILVLGALSFGAMANQVKEVKVSTQSPAGIVSTVIGETLDDMTEKLAQKADKEGAKSFRIVAADSTQNKVHGHALFYK